jgi:hypothetical protein
MDTFDFSIKNNSRNKGIKKVLKRVFVEVQDMNDDILDQI